MPRPGFIAAGVCAGLLLGLYGLPQAAGAKILIRIAETEEAPDLHSGLVAEAREILRQRLAKYTDLVVDPKDAPPEGPALEEFLQKNHLKAYKVFVRLTAAKTEVLPPRQGRPYKQLSATVRAALVGVTLPGDVMALGGDGESQAATEISGSPKPADELALKREALGDALTQAVDKAMARLAQGFRKAPVEKSRRKH
jgi:hypothetical protein